MEDVNISKYRASVVREGSKPASPGFVVSEGQSPTDPAGTGQNHLPVTIAAASTGLSITESQILSGAGTVAQYIRGDGSLADFPEASGGGSSISYYLNGSINQGTIGGVAYKELSKVPILGAGTDFTINADGYIASFLTDAGDPNLLEIPGGNWNFETYFSSSSSGGTPTFYVELYKYDGTTFTLIASNSGSPEFIAFGTTLTAYFSTLAVPTTTLALTDRLAVRYYVTHSGRTITLHTENNHLCQIVTTFTTGLTALNGLTAQVQNFAVGTSGTDFAIASASATHTFNLPTASATNRGALSSADWTTFNNKENAITAGTTAQYFRGDKTFQTLNTSVVPEGTNLYYTEARVNANTNVAANTAARHNAVTLGTANGLSLSTQVLSLGLASAGVTGALSGTDWSTFNSKQNALTLTTTGSSGAATLVGSTLNIPIYSPDLSGYVPTSRTITINGTTQDLSANRTFNVGTVTSVGLSSATSGVTIGSSPITTSGTITLAIATASGSQNGLLSSTDWTTFNSKQNALTNPVTGTGTTNYLPKFTGASTIGNSALQEIGGSLGLGVTPQTWWSSRRALEIFAGGAFAGVNAGWMEVWGNGYLDGTVTSRYLQNGVAGLYQTGNLSTNSHQWYTATSGTAGNAITWVQSMTLTSGGNLLVGTTTDNGARLQVSGTLTASSTTLTASANTYAGGSLKLTSFTGGTNIFLTSVSGLFALSNGGGADHLLIASTGAATFSSSVTAVSLRSVDPANTFSATFGANSATPNWVAVGTIGGVPSINGYTNTFSATTNLALQPNGGNVLIGNTSAYTSRLTVQAAAANRPAIKAGFGASSGNGYWVLGDNYTLDESLTSYGIDYSSGDLVLGSIVAPSTTTSGAFISTQAQFGNLGSAIRAGNSGDIYFFRGTSTSVVSIGGAKSMTESMRINSSGNLLVGTTTDAGYKLDVNGTGRFNGDLTHAGASATSILNIYTVGGTVYNYSGVSGSTNSIINGSVLGDTVIRTINKSILFSTNNGSTSALTITSSGNVGIGTTTDNGARLQVNGAATFSSTLDTSGRVTITADSGNEQFTIRRASNTNAQLISGVHSSSYAWIQSIEQNVAYRPLVLNRDGGNVLIGTTTAQSGTRLQVAGVMDVWSSSNTLLRFNHDGTRGLIETFTGGAYGPTAINANGGNVMIGSTTDNGSKLQVNGAIRTAQPVGTTSNGWLLGRALVSGTSTPNRWIRVQIGLEYYDILAVYMGTL